MVTYIRSLFTGISKCILVAIKKPYDALSFSDFALCAARSNKIPVSYYNQVCNHIYI